MARFLVVGCGAIGGVVAAGLSQGGADVSVLTTNAEIARALRERGLRLSGPGVAPSARATVLNGLGPDVEPFDYVLLATQPPQVEAAARGAVAALAPTGRMVCFQNGLCEERIAGIVGSERVVGAVVAWGASMRAPGEYERTSKGGFTLGRLDGASDARLGELARWLGHIGPVTDTHNLRGARWSKLAINSVISTLGTIGGDRLGVLIRYDFVRRLGLEIMTEAVAVARAEGVRLEKVSGTVDLEAMALSDDQRTNGGPRVWAKHAVLLAVGTRYRKLRSSMLAAIERGREPAVDFLNGEIVDRAIKHGIEVPINAAAREQVWRIARGEARAEHDAVRRLFEATR